MPGEDLESCNPGVWTLVTTADITTGVTVSLWGGDQFYALIKATNGATAPTNQEGAIRLSASDSQQIDDLAATFKGVTSPNRLYVMPQGNTSIQVSTTYD